MKKFFKKIDHWLVFTSPLTKTGIIFLGLAFLLTAVSFAKGIQVLMFVPAFILALFAWSAWDIFWIGKKIEIFQEHTSFHILLPQNVSGYFFKIYIEINGETKYLHPEKENFFFSIPEKFNGLGISFFGRLDVFRKNFPLQKIFASNRIDKKSENFSDITLEIREYQQGDMLENIDPVRTVLGEKIFIRDKIFTDTKKDKKIGNSSALKLESNISLLPTRNIDSEKLLEWGIIGLGILGVFLEWRNFPFTFFAVISAGFILYREKNKKIFSKKFLNPIALFLFFTSTAEGFILADAVETGAHFLLSLAIWKHGFARDRRDGMTYNFLILFVFVALSLFTVSAWFLFLFLGFLVFSSLLFSFFAGGEVSTEFTSRFGSPYTKKFYWKFLSSIFLLTFVFFLLLPHGNAVKNTNSLLKKKENTQTGFSDSVSLNDVQAMKKNFSKALVIEDADEKKIKEYSSWYWRGARFVYFDGTNWKPQKNFKTSWKNFSFSQIPQFPKENISQFSLKISSATGKNLFFPVPPVKILGNIFRINTLDKTLFSLKKNPSTDFFLTVFIPVTPQGKILRSAAPENFPPPEISPVLEKIMQKFWSKIPKEIQNNPEKISHYIQKKFSYSLDAPAKNLEDFLYGSQQGHCEYFATTLALTLQHFGYTATVVNGFHGGEFNPQAQAWIIRNQNAHSWVEIISSQESKNPKEKNPKEKNSKEKNNKEKFWKILDPTPSASISAEKFWFQKVSVLDWGIGIYDTIELRWNKFVIQFTGEAQKKFFLWIFSFWKFYLSLLGIIICWKIFRWWWINKYVFWKHLTEKEKFLYWLGKKNSSKKFLSNTNIEFFLSDLENISPELVQRTQEKIFSNTDFSQEDRMNLMKSWESK